MRKIFWRLHSVVGLVAGLGLLVIGLTGSLLIFHEEIDDAFFAGGNYVEPTAEGRLPLDELVSIVEETYPEKAVTGWWLRADEPGAADGVYVMPFGTREWQYLTIDPYRGELLTDPGKHSETLKGILLGLHESFFLQDVGLAITGILGVALCFLSLSGLYLYRRFWKTLFRLRWKASFRMLTGDVHRMVGVLSVLPNLLLGLTGAYWNVSHTFEHLFESEEDIAAEEAAEPLFYEKLFAPDFSVAALQEKAGEHITDFETHYISFPWAPDGPFTLWGTREDASVLRNPTGSWVSFDSQSGEFLQKYDVTAQGAWTQVEDAFEPLHFGNFGGLPIKILYAVAGLAPAILTISGMTIWWKRRRKPGRRTP